MTRRTILVRHRAVLPTALLAIAGVWAATASVVAGIRLGRGVAARRPASEVVIRLTGFGPLFPSS